VSIDQWFLDELLTNLHVKIKIDGNNYWIELEFLNLADYRVMQPPRKETSHQRKKLD
jgi:hypothetical protein